MVKKLQALKAKKGFTLVELIVVIAIIGVLAAILIPTLSTQITKAKVTSLDKAARALCENVIAWVSENVAAGGNVPGPHAVIQIAVDNGSVVTATNFPAKAPKFDETLEERIESDYPAKTFAAVVFVSVDGKPFACNLCDGTTVVPFDPGAPAPGNYTTSATFTWKSAKLEGVAPDGRVIGTYPKLAYGT